MRFSTMSLLCLLVAGLAGFTVRAVTPQPGEQQLRDQWLTPFLTGEAKRVLSHLQTVQEDVADGIGRGRSWRGTPFQIGEKTYEHGLAFNATKQIRIVLDRPGARFTSDIGLENNDDTRRGAETGNGSVRFQVRVHGQDVLTSPVMRLGDGPKSVDVPLQGAREFEIRVDDGGDGRGWDQALWGGAEIHLQDGARLRLQDLPWPAAVDANPARVSFTYAGQPSASLLEKWTRESRPTSLPDGDTSHEVAFRDPATGLELRVTARLYAGFPAVEWVARFKNTGTNDSALLEKIQAMDTVFSLPATTSATVHWANGGVASFDDFAPHSTELKPGGPFALTAEDGRSSTQILPFFNVEGAGAGVVLAVGWTGRWAAQFESKGQGAVRAHAGMAHTRLVLRPGEEIRTPSMLALFYQGDRWRGQNLLRQFILKHHRPQKDGKPLAAPITCGNWGGTRAEVHLDNIRKFIEHRLPIDYYWIDAGWFGESKPEPVDRWYPNAGYWSVKTNLYPQGFQPLRDLLHQDHRELMLWFEPERVSQGTPWYQEHRNWLLDAGQSSLLLNLGLTEARRFVTDFISARITEFGLGCYRQDYNIDPRPFWEKADAPDRQGMAEIRYVEGLYAFWDGLLAQHPRLIIDNCASGGRRIDLETIGRATPFWRTDGPRDPIAHQCHTYGLLPWVPFSATSQDREGDDYEFRSSMCSSLCINWAHSGDGPCEFLPADFPFDWARRTLTQYVAIRDFYYGDFYPLTTYSKSDDVWMAYQLDRPDQAQGLIVCLRRPRSPYETARLVLRGLEPTATYAATNLDSGVVQRLSGAELMGKGLPAGIRTQPGSALITYRKEP